MNFIGLTNKESKVIELYAKGKTYTDIAIILNMCEVETLAIYLKGLDKIRFKNKLLQTEKKILEIFKVTFVIVICIMPQQKAANRGRTRNPIARVFRVRREQQV